MCWGNLCQPPPRSKHSTPSATFPKGSHAGSTEPMQNPQEVNDPPVKTPPAPEFPPCFEPEFFQGRKCLVEGSGHTTYRYRRGYRDPKIAFLFLREDTDKTLQKNMWCFFCSRIHFLEIFFRGKTNHESPSKMLATCRNTMIFAVGNNWHIQ